MIERENGHEVARHHCSNSGDTGAYSVGVGFLISYFQPANQDIVQVMDDNDSEEVQDQGGRGGVEAGRGGRRRGGLRKQEVDTETH